MRFANLLIQSPLTQPCGVILVVGLMMAAALAAKIRSLT